MVYNKIIRLIIWCKPFARYFLVAWLLTIIIVSSIPSLPTLKIHTEKSDIRLDYLIHFCEYVVLAFMAFLSFTRSDFRLNFRKFIIISLSLIAFAIADEFHQKFIPGRTFNEKDIYSNIAGIAAAIIFCFVVFRKISGMEKKNSQAVTEDR